MLECDFQIFNVIHTVHVDVCGSVMYSTCVNVEFAVLIHTCQTESIVLNYSWGH